MEAINLKILSTSTYVNVNGLISSNTTIISNLFHKMRGSQNPYSTLNSTPLPYIQGLAGIYAMDQVEF